MPDAFPHPLAEPIPFPFSDVEAARLAALERCRSLVERVHASRPEWNPPPFDPRVYADALGIDVSESRELDRWDALLVPLGPELRIICNANVRSEGRKRFSIAHEIGHTFFSNVTDTYQMRTTVDRAEAYGDNDVLALERLCDACAAELLMPAAVFAAHRAQFGGGASAIPELSRLFGVSLEAAALRYLDVADTPCAVGLFELGPPPKRRDDRRPRIAYRVRRAFRSAGFPFLLPVGKSVAEESVVVRASLERGEHEAVEELRLGRRCDRVPVSACALHDGASIDEPPLVVAVFGAAR